MSLKTADNVLNVIEVAIYAFAKFRPGETLQSIADFGGHQVTAITRRDGH